MQFSPRLPDLARPTERAAGGSKPGDGWLLAACAALAVTFAFPQVGLFLSMILAFVIILQAKPQLLPALLVCQLHASDFRIQNYGSKAYWLSRFEEINLFIAGIPVTTNYVILIAMMLRIVYELGTRPRLLRTSCPLWVVVVWLLLLVPPVIIAAEALRDRVPSWTLSVRTALMNGAIFYGAVLSLRWKPGLEYVWTRLLTITVVLMTAAACGVFWARALFVLDAIGPALCVAAFPHRHKLLAAGALLATAIYVTGSGAQEAAYRTHGNVSTTTTLILTSAAAFVLAVITRRKPRHPSSLRAFGLSCLLAAVVLGLPLAAGKLFTELRTDGEYGSHMSLQQRVYHKLFNERAMIWKGALEKIFAPPYVLPKAGDPIVIEFRGRAGLITVGSHNAYLENIRINGWLTGAFGVIAMIAVLFIGCFTLQFESDPYLRALAPALLALGTISASANHFLLEAFAGLWLFIPAGLLLGRLLISRWNRGAATSIRGHHLLAPAMVDTRKVDTR